MNKAELLLEIANCIKEAYAEEVVDGNIKTFVKAFGEIRRGLSAEGFKDDEIMQIISLILTLTYTSGGKN